MTTAISRRRSPVLSPQSKFSKPVAWTLFCFLSLLSLSLSRPAQTQTFNPSQTTFAATAVSVASAPVTITLTAQASGSPTAPVLVTEGVTDASRAEFTLAAAETCGTVTTLSPGQTCTVRVVFTPKFPGIRHGAVLLKTQSGTLLASALLSGIGQGSLPVLFPGEIDLIAGDGQGIFQGDGIPAKSAAIRLPSGLAVDAAGNLFLADTVNSRIRRVDAATQNISTYAGAGTAGFLNDNGPATAAQIALPSQLALDGAGNLYIADTDNNAIRRVDTAGNISTVAGTLGQANYTGDNGPATGATLNAPQGIAVTPSGDLIIADTGNHVIRLVTASDGKIYTIAGTHSPGYNGDNIPAISAQLNSPVSVAIRGSDGAIAIADQNNNRVRLVLAGTITTLAGTGNEGYTGDGGPASQAALHGPDALTFDPAGDLIVADGSNNCVRLVSAAQGTIITLTGTANAEDYSGDGGPEVAAHMHGPDGLFFDASGNLWISDQYNNRVRKVNGSLLSIHYPIIKVGKTSAPVAESMMNAGNEPLTVTAATLQQAALDPSTTACTQGSVAPSLSCSMGVEFAPTHVSPDNQMPITGSITWHTNAPNVTPIDKLSGIVLSVEPTTVAITSSANPGLVGQSITLTATVTSADTGRTGTVIFNEGNSTWCAPSVQLSANGTATCTIPSLSLGVHTFTASYSGDNNNAASQSPSFTETIKQRAALAFSASPNPAVVTTSVTLSIAAQDNSGTPTGAVTLFDGGTQLAVVNLDANGNASWSSNAFAVGTHNLSAQYAGDGSNIPDTAHTTLTVNQASTNTSLSAAYNNVTVGSPVPLTATVSSNVGPALTGSVQFLDGTSVLGSAPLGSNGAATLSATTLAPGTHTLLAVYSGDTDNATSTSAPFAETIQQIATVTTLGADVDPLNAGATVHLAAIVRLTPGAATDGALTGTVTFSDGSTTLGTAPLNASGQATLAVSSLTVGSHSIAAHFSGNTNYAASNSTNLTETVQQTATVTTLSSAATTSLTGKVANFSSLVTSTTGIPTGSVSYRDNGTVLGTSPLDAHGMASFSISALSTGNHQITATYNGDPNYTTSTSPGLQQTVNLAPSAASLSGPSGPVDAGLNVQFTATLTSPGVTPTGTLTLLDGTVPVASVPVSGAATFTFNTTHLAVGSHSLTASYSGDFNNAPAHSVPLSLTVQQAPTAIALVTSTNPLTQKQPLTLTATVTTDSPNATGNVNFYDGPNLLGTVPLTAVGSASFSPQNLGLGTHSLTAVYAGDTNHASSTSAPVPELVVQDATLAVSSSLNPSVSGQNVIFTGQIIGSPTATGNLTFRDNNVILATVPLNATGAASFATTSLSVGTHTVSITYSGDTNFSAASGQLTQTVIAASTSTSISSNLNPATYSQPLTLSATVASNGGLATGAVTFTEAGLPLGSAPLDPHGDASLTLSTLSPGAHTIVASYAGDGKASPSTSTPFLVVVKQITALAVSSPHNPAQTLAPVSLTATITSPQAALPSGSVVFTEGVSTLGTVPVDGSGHATLTLPHMLAGTHTILASYSGDGANFPSQSAAYNQVIQVRSTTTTVTGTSTDLLNPQQMTLIAVVRGDGSVPPGGMVSFTSGPLTLGAAPVDATGVASITVIFETPTQNVIASYPGDPSYAASQSGATPITAGQPAQFTIAVSAPNITLVSHQRTTVNVTVASVKGFTDKIALGCLGLPYAATCTFDKSQLKLNPDGTATASLIIDTGDPLGAGTSTTAAIIPSSRLLLCFPPAGLLAFLFFGKARRKGLPTLLLILLTLAAAGTVTGCSGLQISGTPPGTYSFRVIGTGQGSNTTQAQTVTLVVTQ